MKSGTKRAAQRRRHIRFNKSSHTRQELPATSHIPRESGNVMQEIYGAVVINRRFTM